MTTERIEIVRGPRTLLYGSNALAGVVNVVRGYVPSERPDGLGGSVAYQGESVNRGLSGGLTLEQALGPLALRFDSSLRNADDIATPHGSSPIRTSARPIASVGLSLVRPWGHVGASGSLYDSDYGIPPDPQGGHPDGVSIDLQRQHLEGRGETLIGPDWLKRLEWHHSFSRYQHGEFEASGRLGHGVRRAHAPQRCSGPPRSHGAFCKWRGWPVVRIPQLRCVRAQFHAAGRGIRRCFVYRTKSGSMVLGLSMRPFALTAAASSREKNETRAGSAASRRATSPVYPPACPTTTAPAQI